MKAKKRNTKFEKYLTEKKKEPVGRSKKFGGWRLGMSVFCLSVLPVVRKNIRYVDGWDACFFNDFYYWGGQGSRTRPKNECPFFSFSVSIGNFQKGTWFWRLRDNEVVNKNFKAKELWGSMLSLRCVKKEISNLCN